jgi:aminomethyltransferase
MVISNNEKIKLKVTPLKELHVELGARMVPFAGYEMPVNYPDGIKIEHLHTRKNAGLFDVSHMGQIIITGNGATQALESLVPVDLEALDVNQQIYALLTNDQGGILDDLMIVRRSKNCFFLVVNADCKEKDMEHLRNNLEGLDIDWLDNRALLALQGPEAINVMQELAPALKELLFMSGCCVNLAGIDCYVTRSGYTGEDGFEISVPADSATILAKKLLSFKQVKAIGLGARDSLRLEAGLCLYGHDIDSTTSPVQASLGWSISKSRRTYGKKYAGFLGSKTILEELDHGTEKKRIGLKVLGKAPVREGTELVNSEGKVIGIVTSGGFGPSLNAPIAIGYVEIKYSNIGEELGALVRGKILAVSVQKMPFVPRRYFRG